MIKWLKSKLQQIDNDELLLKTCQTCNGKGRFPSRIGNGLVWISAHDCYDCKGTGKAQRFPDNTLFCKRCLTHEYFWTGGGSWSPDECPCTPSSEGTDVIVWRNMDQATRIKAAKQFDDMWKRKYPPKDTK